VKRPLLNQVESCFPTSVFLVWHNLYNDLGRGFFLVLREELSDIAQGFLEHQRLETRQWHDRTEDTEPAERSSAVENLGHDDTYIRLVGTANQWPMKFLKY